MIAQPPAPPLTEQAQQMEDLWNVFLIGAVAVGLLVAGLVVFVVVRGRRRSDLPLQQREHIPIELAYTAIPLLAVGALFALTLVVLDDVDAESAEDSVDLVVEVTGFQWQWQFRYPASGVVETGTAEERPELALPAGATVRFELASVDVIHSFWIPGFRFKRDLFPGAATTFQVDIGETTGAWPDTGVCAEFCGLDHTTMRFDVAVLAPADFEQWLIGRGGEGAP